MLDIKQQCDNQLQHLRDAPLRRMQQRHIRQIDADVLRLDRRIVAPIAAAPAFAARDKLLSSMPRVAAVLSDTLLALLPAMRRISNRQIAVLIWIMPIALDSGRMKGLRCILDGRARVRRVLFIAAQAAALWNPVMMAFKQRLLAAGKTPKLAIVAVIRKLRTALNAMLRNG